MASSTMPHEIMTWYLLPAIRKGLAREMLKLGMSQREAARRLGVTDAAVSQYLSGRRASGARLGPAVNSELKLAAKRIAAGAGAIGEINKLCGFCTDRLVLCRLHRAHGGPRKCDICFKR